MPQSIRHSRQISVLTKLLLLLLLGGLINLELFILSSCTTRAQTTPRPSSTLQTPLPATPSALFKTPLANPASGFILIDNTPVKLKFKETITSKTAIENQPIDFEVSEDVVLNGVVVIARGATAKGIVAEVKRAKMLGRKGKLSLILKEVQLTSGERISIRANQTQGGGLSAGTIAVSAIVTPFFLLMGGKEAKYTAGTEFSAFVDGDYRLDAAKFGSSATPTQKRPY
jgi:hypothetical protein